MKPIIVCIALLAGIASAQYIEAKIPLPDSFGGVFAGRVVYNPSRERLYAAAISGSKLMVFDASTSTRCGRISLPGQEGDICFDPASNKLYACYYNPATDSYCVAVYSGATDSLVARIEAATCMPIDQFSINSVLGKVLGVAEDGMVVISTSGDSVVAKIEVHGEPLITIPPAFSAASNRHYVAVDYGLVVVDGYGDSVLTRMEFDGTPTVLCHNPVNNTVYCRLSIGTVVVVDCSTNQVISEMLTGNEPSSIAVDSSAARVFCANEYVLYVFDAATNLLIDSVTDLRYPVRVFTNPQRGRVYVADNGIVVLDARTLERLTEIDDQYSRVEDVALSSSGDRVFCLTYYRGIVTLDGLADTVISRMPVGWQFYSRCYHAADRRVYGTEGSSGLVGLDAELVRPPIYSPLYSYLYGPAISCSLYNKLFLTGASGLASYDPATGIATIISAGGVYGTPAHDSIDHQVYCICDPDVVVADCRTGSIINRIPLPSGMRWPSPLQLDVVRQRLYVSGWVSEPLRRIAAIDLGPDTIIWQVNTGMYIDGMVLNPANNCLYCIGSGGPAVTIIDCEQGTVIDSFDLANHRTRGAALSPRSGKVYVAGEPGMGIPGDTLVFVIDCASQSLARAIRVDGAPANPYYDAGHDRLYVPLKMDWPREAVAIIDCRTDSVVSTLEVERLLAGYPTLVGTPDGRVFTGAGGDVPEVTVIRDTTTIGIGEARSLPGEGKKTPTIIRHVLTLPASPRLPVPASLLDATGRRVMVLQPGPSDVRHLAPGVYFIRQPSVVSGKPSAISKIVLTR